VLVFVDAQDGTVKIARPKRSRSRSTSRHGRADG
jgi:hypothetical protein